MKVDNVEMRSKGPGGIFRMWDAEVELSDGAFIRLGYQNTREDGVCIYDAAVHLGDNRWLEVLPEDLFKALGEGSEDRAKAAIDLHEQEYGVPPKYETIREDL